MGSLHQNRRSREEAGESQTTQRAVAAMGASNEVITFTVGADGALLAQTQASPKRETPPPNDAAVPEPPHRSEVEDRRALLMRLIDGRDGGASADRAEALAATMRTWCERLIDDEDEEEDAPALLAKIAARVAVDEDARVLLEPLGVLRAALTWFTTEACRPAVADMLRTAIGSRHAPMHGLAASEATLARLVGFATDPHGDLGAQREALTVLTHAAAIAPVPSAPAAWPAQLLSRFHDDDALWRATPVSCGPALVAIAASPCAVAAGPLSFLLRAFEGAETLAGAFEELTDARIPSHADRVTTPEEAAAFFARERKRCFNPAALALRHAALAAFAAVTCVGGPSHACRLSAKGGREREERERGAAALRGEAFKRGAGGRLEPTPLLGRLLSIAADLSARAPHQSAPSVDMAGMPAAYRRRKVASDVAANPFGEAIATHPFAPDFSGGDISSDSAPLPAVPRHHPPPLPPARLAPGLAFGEASPSLSPSSHAQGEGEGEGEGEGNFPRHTLLEACLEILASCCERGRNGAVVLWREGLPFLLRELGGYADGGVRRIVRRIVAALAVRCGQSAVQALCDPTPLSSLSSLSSPPGRERKGGGGGEGGGGGGEGGLDAGDDVSSVVLWAGVMQSGRHEAMRCALLRLLLAVDGMSGDAFAEVNAPGSLWSLCHTLLCR